MIVPRGITATGAILTAIAVVLVGPLAGCSKNNNAPTARYTVRGEIAALPVANDPTSDFRVHHEAIPSFRASWPDGPLGMKSMTMPFPVAEGLSLDGLKVGEAIELTFAVDYDPKTGKVSSFRATAVKPLPAGTMLDFGGKPAPAPKAAD